MSLNVKQLKQSINHLKVLFVDDEEDIREGTSLFLRKFFDDVVVCVNGRDGIDTYEEVLKEKNKRNFDIVITDIKMPKLDGAKMLEMIKNHDSDIFSVFITASRGEFVVKEDLYDLYITKPISYEDIMLIMQTIYEKKVEK